MRQVSKPYETPTMFPLLEGNIDTRQVDASYTGDIIPGIVVTITANGVKPCNGPSGEQPIGLAFGYRTQKNDDTASGGGLPFYVFYGKYKVMSEAIATGATFTVGAPVYCDANGKLTGTKSGNAKRVGRVVEVGTNYVIIYLDIE